ncbi:hypothetical protein BD626DRAFT_567085 [Schizophyllum amplum]|uniref:LYC1 C-terminal domain-containing protein n=1 Tax=Schizophyllum amplum TaxID=97359 RepID=A0A550CK41_9AGAR|nr:hypothetical protein BD626DRAFT_567085 [Auriculariopsis ampla]
MAPTTDMEELRNLSLYPATPEQIYEYRSRMFPSWGRGHTREQYDARDNALDDLEHAADGKMVSWVLAPRDHPKSLDFKCACETYRRKGRYYDGEMKTVTCYGIASVFTPDRNRRKGYAKHMMHLLHWVLADEQFLKDFPGVGSPPPREFYKACGDTLTTGGWVTQDAMSTIWEVEVTASKVSAPASGWEWLSEKEVGEVWKEDVPLLEKEIMERAKEVGKPVAAFMPDHGVGAFQHMRLVLSEPHGPLITKSWGVKATEGSLAYATWSVDVHGLTPTVRKTLLLTRLRVQSQEQFKELMGMVVGLAKEGGFQKVEFWNLPANLEAEAQTMGGVTSERTAHFPSIKCYASDDVVWVFNEKWA